MNETTPDGFELLSDDNYSYSKNHQYLFLKNEVITGADPKTFEVIEFQYTKDKNDVYCDTIPMILSPEEVKTFKVTNEDKSMKRLISTIKLSHLMELYPDYLYMNDQEIEITNVISGEWGTGSAEIKNLKLLKKPDKKLIMKEKLSNRLSLNSFLFIKNRVILFMFNWSIFSCNSQTFQIPPVYDAVLPFKNGIAAVKKGAYWGFINTTNQWVFEPKFSMVKYTDQGEYFIISENKKNQEILTREKNGKWVITPYDGNDQEINTSSGLRVIRQVNNKFYLLDQNKNQISKIHYDNLVYTGEDLFVGSLHGHGDQLINAEGKIVSEFYREITPEVKFGRIKFKRDQYSGLLDTKGRIVVQPVWWLLEIAGKNIACTHGGDLKLYSDQLVVLSDFEFDVLFSFNNGNWIGKNADTGESKLFNPEGKVLKDDLKFGYGGIYKGMIPAENNIGLYGYVNEDGKEMIPFNYKYAESFMPSGKAVVWYNDNGRNKGGIIDTQGREVITPKFEKIEWQVDGIYTIEYENKYQLLDQNFKPITKLSKNPVEYLGNGVYAQYKTGRSLKVQKSNFYTGDKFKIYRSRDVEIASFHALDGTLLVKADEMQDGDMIPKVTEGMAISKSKGKWGFIQLH